VDETRRIIKIKNLRKSRMERTDLCNCCI